MRRYEVEVMHEPSGAYLNYVTFSDALDIPDLYKEFIRDISVVIVDQEEVDEDELDTVDSF